MSQSFFIILTARCCSFLQFINVLCVFQTNLSEQSTGPGLLYYSWCRTMFFISHKLSADSFIHAAKHSSVAAFIHTCVCVFVFMFVRAVVTLNMDSTGTACAILGIKKSLYVPTHEGTCMCKLTKQNESLHFHILRAVGGIHWI